VNQQQRKSGRLQRRYAWVSLSLPILILIFVLVSCDATPDPGTSPITTQADDDEPFGYFSFDAMGAMTGTVTISQTLRTLDGRALSSRTFITQLGVPNVMTDTIVSEPFAVSDWAIWPGETVEEWTETRWRVQRQYGDDVTIAGVWYTDTSGPPAVPVGDAYMTRRIELWRVFMPLFFE